MTEQTERLPRIEVHPDVLFDLGDRLISDEVTAIVELVKNAYDADATWARVEVATRGKLEADSFYSKGPPGVIEVADNGSGMSRDEIENGWLLVAASRKREAKDRNRKTPLFGRTPLGDKGLGRLGVQRLGDRVELYTRRSVVTASGSKRQLSPTSEEFHVGIDWDAVRRHDRLSEVPVEFVSASDLRPGTRIVISNLRSATAWSPERFSELAGSLSQFVSPFEDVKAFEVLPTIDGTTIDLVPISRQVLQAATHEVAFEFAQGRLRVELRYRLSALRGTGLDARTFDRLTSGDNGTALFDHVARDTKLRDLQQELRQNWWAVVEFSEELATLKGAELTGPRGKVHPVDPGPFHGKIYSFTLAEDPASIVASGATARIRTLLAVQKGVRVYRDGFAIRPYGLNGQDWLDLGAQWTSGTSYYGLKPANVVGYVALGADANRQLVEKTDREGFVDSQAYRNFQLLMSTVVGHSNKTTAAIRRSYNRFREADAKRGARLEEDEDETHLFERMRRTGRTGVELRTRAFELEARAVALERVSRELRAEGRGEGLAEEVEAAAALGRQTADVLTRHAMDVAALPETADVLELDRERLEEQTEDFADLAALGLSAETMSHELRLISNGLLLRTSATRDYMRDHRIEDSRVATYLDFVRSTVTSIRNQLAHLEPALRYMREHVDEFGLRDFVHDVIAYHRPSLRRVGIDIVVDEPFDNRTITMNRGRLTQVLDNLITNSRYWLAADLKAERVKDATIHLRSADGNLDVWDNGRGVDPTIEARLFTAFVTTKPKGEGRGLGLFISRELMQTSGGDLTLLADSSPSGSRSVFRVTLPRAA